MNNDSTLTKGLYRTFSHNHYVALWALRLIVSRKPLDEVEGAGVWPVICRSRNLRHRQFCLVLMGVCL